MIIILGGIMLGLLIPVGVSGNLGFRSCGAPWLPSAPTDYHDAAVAAISGRVNTDYYSLCTEAKQYPRLIAIALVVVGVIVSAASLIPWKRQSTR